MKKITCCVVALCLLLSGCAEYTQEEVDSLVSGTQAYAYSQGYKEGYEEWHNEGISEAYDSAYSSGYEDGKEEGHLVTAAEYSKKILDLMKRFEQPYPETGTVFLSEYSCYAPLTVENPTDTAYYFKLYDYTDEGNSEHGVLTFFVAPQTTAEILAPLGTYSLKYAYSNGAWYGTEMLFGDDTLAALFADTFEFTDDGYSYYGYTLSMEEEIGGNLHSIPVSAETF